MVLPASAALAPNGVEARRSNSREAQRSYKLGAGVTVLPDQGTDFSGRGVNAILRVV